MRRRLLAALLVTLIVLAGCARDLGGDVARPAEPGDVPTPYTGPLYVGPAEARNDLERTAGAAGRIVVCTTRVTGDLNPGDQEVRPSPEDGLSLWLGNHTSGVPVKYYLLERQEGDRALFTFRVSGQPKAAGIVVNSSRGGSVGWHLESWASCDTSEFPDASLPDPVPQIWTNADGRRVPTYQIQFYRGHAHCDWERLTFLTLDENWKQAYVRRVPKEYVGSFVAEPYRSAVRRPDDVVDTGYRRDGRELWLSADRTRAYLGVPGAATVELWPRTTQPLVCA